MPPIGTSEVAVKAATTKRASGYMEEWSKRIVEHNKRIGNKPPRSTPESIAKGALTRTGKKHKPHKNKGIKLGPRKVPSGDSTAKL